MKSIDDRIKNVKNLIEYCERELEDCEELAKDYYRGWLHELRTDLAVLRERI